jgi:hypothetical protein
MHENREPLEEKKAANIRIQDDTKQEFEKCGKYGDTADSILKKLINFYNKYKDRIKNGKQ